MERIGDKFILTLVSNPIIPRMRRVVANRVGQLVSSRCELHGRCLDSPRGVFSSALRPCHVTLVKGFLNGYRPPSPILCTIVYYEQRLFNQPAAPLIPSLFNLDSHSCNGSILPPRRSLKEIYLNKLTLRKDDDREGVMRKKYARSRESCGK